MSKLIGIAVMTASTIMVFFLHTVLMAEVIPIVLLLLSAFFVTVDYPRRYFYLVGLALYPSITTISVAVKHDKSLYPIIIFYELSMVVMVLFGIFIGTKVNRWIEEKSKRSAQ